MEKVGIDILALPYIVMKIKLQKRITEENDS